MNNPAPATAVTLRDTVATEISTIAPAVADRVVKHFVDTEFIGWGHTVGDPHDCFEIHRYIPTEHGYGPTNEDGSDRDGDFWTVYPDPDAFADHCRGKPDSSFIWCDAPDPTTRLPITSTHVLEALKRSGKITDEDILSAKAAVKLMRII